MTDPIQWTNPQQQGQQWYTDDILWWEDIFATIPEAEIEEAEEADEDLPYGDMMEKKYQFEPIPEETVPVPPVQVRPVTPPPRPAAPTPAPKPFVSRPIPPASTQQVTQHVAAEEIHDIENQSSLEQSQVEWLLDTKLQTDVQKKFGELFFTTKKIYELKDTL